MTTWRDLAECSWKRVADRRQGAVIQFVGWTWCRELLSINITQGPRLGSTLVPLNNEFLVRNIYTHNPSTRSSDKCIWMSIVSVASRCYWNENLVTVLSWRNGQIGSDADLCICNGGCQRSNGPHMCEQDMRVTWYTSSLTEPSQTMNKSMRLFVWWQTDRTGSVGLREWRGSGGNFTSVAKLMLEMKKKHKLLNLIKLVYRLFYSKVIS